MEEKVKVEGKVETKAEVKVREDLNNIVKSIGFIGPEKGRYGESPAKCVVTFFNGLKMEFNDKDGLYDLLKSYELSGEEGYLKSKALVEEIKNSKVDVSEEEVDAEDNKYTYVCVLYRLVKDGGVRDFRLFPKKRFVSRGIIDNCYKQYKRQQKNK